jgi:hypothetical protein
LRCAVDVLFVYYGCGKSNRTIPDWELAPPKHHILHVLSLELHDALLLTAMVRSSQLPHHCASGSSITSMSGPRWCHFAILVAESRQVFLLLIRSLTSILANRYRDSNVCILATMRPRCRACRRRKSTRVQLPARHIRPTLGRAECSGPLAVGQDSLRLSTSGSPSESKMYAKTPHFASGPTIRAMKCLRPTVVRIQRQAGRGGDVWLRVNT